MWAKLFLYFCWIVFYKTVTVRLTDASGTFSSGNYPDTGAADQAWEIAVDPNHQILLQFLNFSLNETTACTVDGRGVRI